MTTLWIDKDTLARNIEPITLDAVMDQLIAMNNRIIRIETRLVRSLLADGLGVDGNVPNDGQTDTVSHCPN